MTADLVLLFLIRAQVAASAAVLLVLATRPLVRRYLGPSLAYWLWRLPIAAALVSLFPTLRDFTQGGSIPAIADLHVFGGLEASGVLTGFAIGAAALATVFLASEWRFRRLARRGEVGPAVVGASWPTVVMPRGYEARFSAAERRLILLHEHTHIERDHPQHNRLIAAAQVLGWFNPLVHLAAHCARLDQELACDAAVLECAGVSRRLYAETLLKAQSTGPWSVFACALAHGGRHPLEIRIQALRTPPISLRRYLFAAAVICALGAAMTLSLWVLSPQTFAS